MTNVRIMQLGWLGTLLGLCVACGAQVRNLGDEGSLGGVGNGTGGTTAVTTEATGGASPATSGATGGSTAQGGTGNATGSGGSAGATVTVNCPAYTSGTGDTLITPPSTGFESGLGSWTSTSEVASKVSLTQGATTACEGTSYLVCNGAARSASWDGPAIDVLPYVVAGHQYTVALAARVDPASSPTSGMTLRLTTGIMCTNSSSPATYSDLYISTSRDWNRMSGKFQASMDNCSQLAHLYVYVSTNETNAPYASIDVDDFQLWDVTPATGN